MSNSPFIEGSKHADLTKAVEDHFFKEANPQHLTKYPAGGDPSQPYQDKPQPFNPDSGVNYVPRERAGHKV